MGELAELHLQTAYHRGRDDIAGDFYLPAMRCAVEYDRAVGYFRSAIFAISWPGLRDFVARGGRMRVLCSQVLAAEDIDALELGYAARLDASLEARLLEEVRSLLADATLGAPARILAALVANGVMEIKIAVMRASQSGATGPRIFHDKLGIFRDQVGNVVIFKGSMNETWSGLSADGNLESVDVAASWLGTRDLERTHSEESYFADLWADRYPGLSVRRFPDVARAELVGAAPSDWEGSLEILLREASSPTPADPKNRTLWPHQSTALAAWEANGRHGILQLATGSGKTLIAMTAIRTAIEQHGEIPIVVVPSDALFHQWLDQEIKPLAAQLDAQVLRVGVGNDRWREVLRAFTRPGEKRRLVLASLGTAATPSFREALTAGSHLLLVADEVHRLGSHANQALLDPTLFGPRLGVSATPEREGDPAGTDALLTYFGGILEPRYTLQDAITDGFLTSYFYRPHTVSLSETEADEWKELSRKISVLRARTADSSDPDLERRVEMLQFARARVVKQASAKVPLAVEVLKSDYAQGQRWIVYCDDLNQLGAVSRELGKAGIDNQPYHSQMEGDRGETLRWLDLRGGVVVAIKCLDEGIDIPAVTHALILASSKNSREFIQRRGRVLRKHPGKALSYIHDAIVVPVRDDEATGPDPIAAGEMGRAVEFARNAANPAAFADLQQIAIDAGIDWQTASQWGLENADE